MYITMNMYVQLVLIIIKSVQVIRGVTVKCSAYVRMSPDLEDVVHDRTFLSQTRFGTLLKNFTIQNFPLYNT